MSKRIEDMKFRSTEIENSETENGECDIYEWIVDLLINHWIETKKPK